MGIILGMIQHNLLHRQTAVSYPTYREIIRQMVDNNSTSGKEQSETRVNFTALNNRRMDRLDKTIKVPIDFENRIAKFKDDITWLVITESWCGDAVQIIPVIYKVAQLNKGINLRLVFRDQNEDLMDLFLTNGTRAIPKLIMIDNEDEQVIGSYGPRPSTVTKIVEEFKQIHGKLTPEFKEDLQRWYNNDKGLTIMEDLANLLRV